MTSHLPQSGQQIVIAGAGISGLSAARMLQDHFNVTVIEKTDKPGGLIKCRDVDGNLFHMVGGHVFNSKNETVLHWFWQFFDREKEFLKTSRNAKIFLGGKFIGYPIENFLYQLPEAVTAPVITDMLHAACQPPGSPENNFEAFLQQKFGPTLYELYFGPYNRKLWQTNLQNIPLAWLDGKLPMPDVQHILVDNILRKQETTMVHANFYYPVKGGSQFIINRLAEDIDVRLSYAVHTIGFDGDDVVINNDMRARHLVYCGDIRKLHLQLQHADSEWQDALEAVRDLPSNGTSNALCETDETDISWLYLPEPQFKAHRIIYTGNFSEANNQPGNRKTCVVEFSGCHSEASVAEEIRKLPGNLRMIAFNYEPDSYIIHERATAEKVTRVKQLLEKKNIHLLGRFAEWQYYNMDKCIEFAMRLRDKLVNAYERR